MKNSGNYVKYTGYGMGLKYAEDGSNYDGVHVYVDVGQHAMKNAGNCRVASSEYECTGHCSIGKNHFNSCVDKNFYCNEANGYGRSDDRYDNCGGSMHSCYCHCCYDSTSCSRDNNQRIHLNNDLC